MKLLSLSISSIFIFFAICWGQEINQIWQTKMPENEKILESRVVGDKAILSTTRGITAININNGQEIWRYSYPEGSYCIGIPVIGDKIAVYWKYFYKTVKEENSKASILVAINLENGNFLWEKDTSLELHLTKFITDDYLITASIIKTKQLKLEKIIEEYEIPCTQRKAPEERQIYLNFYDIYSGDLLKEMNCFGWPMFLTQINDKLYFSLYYCTEPESIDKGERSELLAVYKDSLHIAWEFYPNIFQKTDFRKLLKIGQGLIVYSSGFGFSTGIGSSTTSYLLNEETGEKIGGETLAYLANYIISDSLWTFYSMSWYEYLELTDIKEFKQVKAIKLKNCLVYSFNGLNNNSIQGLLNSLSTNLSPELTPKGVVLIYNESINMASENSVLMNERGLFMVGAKKGEINWQKFDLNFTKKPVWTNNDIYKDNILFVTL